MVSRTDSMIGTTFGGCVLESKIGQGGMGTVYKAFHSTLNIPVAVKLLHSLEDTPGSEERFLREAQIAARLRHPCIVSIMNAGVEHGFHFIVMEYVEGRNLQQMITENTRLSVDTTLTIAITILHALEAAVQQGIVHRDIKPENILIDKSGNSKLADLGLARIISGSEKLTQSSTMLGSPHYIAPEQADNPSSVDCRTDIYSLGCTLYHMLSGSPPYPGDSLVEIIMNHVKSPIPHLKDTTKDTPEYIADIIFTMMQKEPTKRFSSPTEVIRAFEYRKSTIIPSVGVASQATVQQPRKPGSALTVGTVSAVVLFLIIFGGTELRKNSRRQITFAPAFTTDTLSQLVDTTRSEAKDSVKPGEKTPPRKRVVTKPSPSTRDASVISQTTHKENPLIAVVKIGDTEGVKALLAKGISPLCDPSSPTTPLHEAVRRGLTVETQLLLKSGADADALDMNGNTALHYAVKENASLIINLLLEHDADPNIKDRSGRTPLQMAKSIDTDLEKLLERHGAK